LSKSPTKIVIVFLSSPELASLGGGILLEELSIGDKVSYLLTM